MDPKSLHIDMALSNFAVKLGQGSYAAPRMLPVLPVTKESDWYYIFGQEDIADDVLTPSAAGVPAGEVEWSKTQAQFITREYKLKHLIPQRTIDNADPAANPNTRTTQVLRGKVMLAYERRAMKVLTTAANWPTASKSTFTHNLTTGDTIEQDIDAAREAVSLNSGFEPNTVLIQSGDAKKIKRSPNVRDIVKYTATDLLVNGDLPPRLWNLDVVIPGARQNTANPGQTAALSRVWPAGSVIVAYIDPNPSVETPTLGLTFRKSDYGVQGERVRRWYNEDRDGWFVEYGMLQSEAIVSYECGFLLTGG